MLYLFLKLFLNDSNNSEVVSILIVNFNHKILGLTIGSSSVVF